MAVTSVLLIVVCLAWYVTNKEAYVTGVTGSIVEDNSIIEGIEYYEATAQTATSFTFTKLENTSGTVEMGTYNPLDSASYPQRMLAITIREDVTSVVITAKTKAISYLGNTIKDSEGNFILSKDEPNSLTSVIGFYIPSAVSIVDGIATATISEDDEQYFVNVDDDTMVYTLELGTIKPINNVVYIILDYYEDSIEHIYSENIGNTALDYVGEPTEENPHINDIEYECDFYFLLKEGA